MRKTRYLKCKKYVPFSKKNVQQVYNTITGKVEDRFTADYALIEIWAYKKRDATYIFDLANIRYEGVEAHDNEGVELQVKKEKVFKGLLNAEMKFNITKAQLN